MDDSSYEQLKLENQLCFPVYAASRLIIREYQPYLERLGITYPQYLVLMVLWQSDGITVNEISNKLILNTNTLTPLLKRMESMELLSRERSQTDERKVLIQLTPKGRELRIQAASIPEALITQLQQSPLSMEQMLQLKASLDLLIGFLRKKGNETAPE